MSMTTEKTINKPELPDGWTYIEDLQAGLDLGEHGEELADYGDCIGDAIGEVADSNVNIYTADLKKWIIADENDQWIEKAKVQGLLEGVDDFTKMIQMAQYECFSADLCEHQEDAVRYAIYEHVKDEHGAVAISDELAERIEDIDCSDNNDRFTDLYEQADKTIEGIIESLVEQGEEVRVCLTKEQVRELAAALSAPAPAEQRLAGEAELRSPSIPTLKQAVAAKSPAAAKGNAERAASARNGRSQSRQTRSNPTI